MVWGLRDGAYAYARVDSAGSGAVLGTPGAFLHASACSGLVVAQRDGHRVRECGGFGRGSSDDVVLVVFVGAGTWT